MNRSLASGAWPVVATAGDVAVFLVFAGIGRSSHGEQGTVAQVIGTAAPFVGAWLACALIAGAFRPAPLTRVDAAVRAVTVAWVGAFVAGMVIRSIALHHLPPPGFTIVTLLFNGVLLLVWRSSLAWLGCRVSRS